MNPFRVHKGRVAPLDRINVDTDQIIPKQFLKRIERTGFGQFLFYDWRFSADGRKNADSAQGKLVQGQFILDQPRYKGASILVAGKNFGCGSSREHAVWALTDFGFRVVISSSFADIFANNSTKNGFLTVQLTDDELSTLMKRAQEIDDYRVTVDLDQCEVRDEQGFRARFPIDDFVRQRSGSGPSRRAVRISDHIHVIQNAGGRTFRYSAFDDDVVTRKGSRRG